MLFPGFVLFVKIFLFVLAERANSLKINRASHFATRLAERGGIENVLSVPTTNLENEFFSKLLDSKNCQEFRIERIVSTGQSSPTGFWYNQEENEWIVLLQGCASIEMMERDGGKSVMHLIPGSMLYIPRHKRHRVLTTSNDHPTIWLAVFHDGPPGAQTLIANYKVENGRLQQLCDICVECCKLLSPLVCKIYEEIQTQNVGVTTWKDDGSAFTIADGLVQYLLTEVLFRDRFLAIVGEEDKDDVVDTDGTNSDGKMYVKGLTIPDHIKPLLASAESAITRLAAQVDVGSFKDITIFIDPIDGTKEFSSGRGEQCSICIGFAQGAPQAPLSGQVLSKGGVVGEPVAGVVYRPLTGEWAAGAKSESFAANNLRPVSSNEPQQQCGYLTSNSRVSPFVKQLIEELGCVAVPSGGVGNKALMLLEGHGNYYVQDRGVSRWDTCAVQAVLEAHGGGLWKLWPFAKYNRLESYQYEQSEVNLDFVGDVATLTAYNQREARADGSGLVSSPSQVKPYSNILGLLAVSPEAFCSSSPSPASGVAAMDEHALAHVRAAIDRALVHVHLQPQYD